MADGASRRRGHVAHPSSFRRPRPHGYRAEWRRLAAAGLEDALFDVHYETALDPAALRRFLLSIPDFALGGEFRVRAPGGRVVDTDLAAVEAWVPSAGSLPAPALDGMWRAERELAAAVEDMVADVRAAVMRGVERGAIGRRDALYLADMARSVARVFPV